MYTYNDLERICFILIINTGDALFAFAFGMIASIQAQISQNNDFQKFLHKMNKVHDFMNAIEVSDS